MAGYAAPTKPNQQQKDRTMPKIQNRTYTPIPEGKYEMRLKGSRVETVNHPKYGPRDRIYWTFEVLDDSLKTPEGENRTYTAITNVNYGAKQGTLRPLLGMLCGSEAWAEKFMEVFADTSAFHAPGLEWKGTVKIVHSKADNGTVYDNIRDAEPASGWLKSLVAKKDKVFAYLDGLEAQTPNPAGGTLDLDEDGLADPFAE